jgi:hypothetical protein
MVIVDSSAVMSFIVFVGSWPTRAPGKMENLASMRVECLVPMP